VPAAEEPAVLFLRASTERHLVGIPVGIDSNWWRKFFQIQLVLVLGDCRPGEARRLESPIIRGGYAPLIRGATHLFVGRRTARA